MKEYMIYLLFLFFVNFNDGHTLARIELNNITDVYEVKEGQSTLTITHPQDDKAVLREIVYFHVIEKPYDKQDEVAKTPELEPRSFTNAHGYQYTDGNNNFIDSADREDNDDDGDDETPEKDDDTSDQDEYDDGDENEIEAKTTEITTAQDEYNSDENNENQTADRSDDVGEELIKDVDDKKIVTIKDNDDGGKNDVNDKEIGRIHDIDIPKDDVENKEPENLDVRFGDSDNTPVDNKPIQVQSESRRKREINYRNLPDAPELPEFNLDILPDYIKAIIFADQDNNNNEKDNIEDEIEKQVQELERAANHPPSVEKENDRKMNARIRNSLDIDRKDGDQKATYGMSLAGNSGKVWNNINTHHLHYVSEPETHLNTNPKQDITDSTTQAYIATDAPSETSYEDIRVNNDFNKPKNFDNDLKDIEDSFDEVKKQLDELIRNSEDETIAATTVTTDYTSDINNIEESYIVELPKSIEDNFNKKREGKNGNSIEDDKKGNKKREVRTYGMSLAGDSGVVWNDVNTHLSYRVGEPESIESTTSVTENVTASTKAPTTVTIDKRNKDSQESKELNELDELKDIEESLDQINKMLDELINSTKEVQPSTDKSTNTPDGNNNGDKKDDKDSDEYKNIEDSFDEINKLLEELIRNSTSETTTEGNKDTKEPDHENESTTSTTEEISFTKSTTTEVTTTELTTTKSTSLDETTDKSLSTPKPDIKNPKDNDMEGKHNNETTKHDNEDSKQKQFVKELMKNKFFWQWLQDSSAAYLEVMMKKLDGLIKAEVGNQIKQYFKEHKNVTNCKPEIKEPQNNTSEKPVESNNVTDTIVTTEKPVETNLDVNVNKTTQNPIVNKEPNEKLNKTVDETENNNLTEDELARKQNKDAKDTPVKIEANNVYGSSVGNGKVTNIFIFNISKESDLENIKPLSNGTNGVFVFGLDDKTDKGNKHNDDNNKNNELDMVTTAKPEKVTDPTTEEPKDNSIDQTTKTTVEGEQTTSTESSRTTTVTHVDDVSSTTEKVIESTTEAKESSTEDSQDKTDEEEVKPEQDKPTESPENDSKSSETTTDAHVDEVSSTTETVKESSTENSKDKTDSDEAKQDKPTESPENDKQNNDEKPTDVNKDKNDETQSDKEINNTTTTESNEANSDVASNDDKIDTTEKAEVKDETDLVTKSNEVTSDKIIESTTGRDKSEENEIDHNE